MRWNSSTLDYFSKTNPNNVFSFWRSHKISCFLEEVLDFERANLLNSVHLKFNKNLRNLKFGKKWLRLDNFLILFAFLKMLNENQGKMRAFFSDILNEYYFSDQVEAQKIMEDVYCCINDELSNCLDLGFNYPKKKVAEVSEEVRNSNDPNMEVIVLASKKEGSGEVFEKGSGFSEKKNPFGFEFAECASMQERVNQLHKEFVKESKPSANYKYASNTIKSLMRRSVRKEHPLVAAKQVFGYIAGGFCFALAAAAIAYLTIQTAGLIHLTWIIPTAILAIIGGVSAAAGTGLTLKSTPAISNQIYNFFKEKKRNKSPIRGQLFSERHPIGMMV